jgi:thioredoxin-related protein
LGCINTKVTQKEIGIQWLSISELSEKMKMEPKKVFFDVYATWCGPCKMLDRNTFSNRKVIEYMNKHFYAVKWNGESTDTVIFKGKTYINANPNKKHSNHNLTYELAYINGGIRYPTMLFFDEELDKVMGKAMFMYPEDLLLDLEYIGEDYYLKQSYPEFLEMKQSESNGY